MKTPFPCASAGKVLLTVFYRRLRSTIVKFLEHRGTITFDVYCETIQSLRRSIKNKRQELLTERVVLLHDNARLHMSRVAHMKREQLDHPLFSPDISPYDFYVFDLLKKHLKGHRFNLDDKLKDTEKNYVSLRPQTFWEHEIIRLVC